MTQKVAVIGAGMAGLSCAAYLRQSGYFVEVFEQDRVIGGRVATMRNGLVAFDSGAQYLTARTDRFRTYINGLCASGYAAKWEPKTTSGDRQGVQLHTWFVGTPGMSSIVRPLTESVRVHTSKRVHTIRDNGKGWMLWFEDETSVGPFAAVAVCVPAPQARLLLGHLDGMADAIGRVRMMPSWAAMLRFENKILPDQDVYSDMSEVIRWIARNSSKPGRGGKGETIVIHASPNWSRETLDIEPEVVAEELWREVSSVLRLPKAQPQISMAHLWQHGLVDQALGESCLFSSHYKVGAAGDWCLGRLAEQAFESGQSLARAIAQALG